MPVDNFTLSKWRQLDATFVLLRIAEHAKLDSTFRARTTGETRWNALVDGRHFELVMNGPKFFDLRAGKGGGGAIDLIMYLTRSPFKDAVKWLKEHGL